MDEITHLVSIDESTDFLSGQLLLVDKPLKWTSFDVVNKIRFALKQRLGVKKIKVGHAGTLDPLATGLLLIAVGKMTKSIQHLTGLNKTYRGTITFGGTTPTYDAEMPIEQNYDYQHISAEMLEDQKRKFLGSIMQTPPVFSAIKKEGVRAYKLAREGKPVQMEKRSVEIHQFDLAKIEMPNVDFEITCSKGTYIRSIAHDLGQACQSGAYLSRLVRTKIDDYTLDNAWDLSELIKNIQAVKHEN